MSSQHVERVLISGLKSQPSLPQKVVAMTKTDGDVTWKAPPREGSSAKSWKRTDNPPSPLWAGNCSNLRFRFPTTRGFQARAVRRKRQTLRGPHSSSVIPAQLGGTKTGPDRTTDNFKPRFFFFSSWKKKTKTLYKELEGKGTLGPEVKKIEGPDATSDFN